MCVTITNVLLKYFNFARQSDKKPSNMKCLFCDSMNSSDSYLPSTFFNKKQFNYRKCNDCDLIYINPIPTEEDLELMYPPSYQDGTLATILKNPYEKLLGLRFSYGYQFDLLKKVQFKGSMLDFGCGNANFIVNSNKNGFPCDGVEYNSDHITILKKGIAESNFYQVDEFLASEKTYDLIRFSNVLEHFNDPKSVMEKLKNKLNSRGYSLVEGPVETNFSFALQFRKIYFRLRKLIQSEYVVSHTPTHIIFTNKKNQLNFFEELNLQKKELKFSEAEWPFPPSFKAAVGVVSKINVVIAKVSIALKGLNKNWGNTFIYLGQLK